jgi:hypothetical protein
LVRRGRKWSEQRQLCGRKQRKNGSWLKFHWKSNKISALINDSMQNKIPNTYRSQESQEKTKYVGV